jgi:hypothetical protein
MSEYYLDPDLVLAKWPKLCFSADNRPMNKAKNRSVTREGVIVFSEIANILSHQSLSIKPIKLIRL